VAGTWGVNPLGHHIPKNGIWCPICRVADAGCKWFGEDRPDRSGDHNISARHPPHRHETISWSWTGPSGIIKNQCDGRPGRISPEPSQRDELELLESPRYQRTPPKHPTTHRAHPDHPHLIEEEAEMMPVNSLSPGSINMRTQSTDQQKGGAVSFAESSSLLPSHQAVSKEGRGGNGRLEDDDLGAQNKVVLEMQQLLAQFALNIQHDNKHHTRRQLTLVGNCLGKPQPPGRAIRQIELSRRGFYPRRDVIKWQNNKPEGIITVFEVDPFPEKFVSKNP
jgi:hypothetical protein